MGSLIFRGVTLEDFIYRCVVDGKAGLSFFLLAALLDYGFACVPSVRGAASRIQRPSRKKKILRPPVGRKVGCLWRWKNEKPFCSGEQILCFLGKLLFWL